MRLPIGALLISSSLFGCGKGVDTLNIYYVNEVVEAPTRSVSIKVARGAENCSQVLSRPHSALSEGETLVLEKLDRYPADPNNQHLLEAPLGEPIAIDIVGLNANLFQVSRACRMVTLSPSEDVEIGIELRALPSCEDVPVSALDVTIAIDTSLNALFADAPRAHLDALKSVLLDPNALPIGSTKSIVTFGHGPDDADRVQEVLAPTDDNEAAINAVNGLYSVQQGETLLYDGITRSTELLRARALCGRRPALVLIVSGLDQASASEYEDASIGLFANPGDKEDDVYSASVALTDEGFAIMDMLVPEGFGDVTGGGFAPQLEAAFIDVRGWLNGLLIPETTGE